METRRFTPGEDLPYRYKYEHMAVTVDCVIFTYDSRKLKVLLIKRGTPPFEGEWALPGGFLRMDETAREGAARELCEETGVSQAPIRELGVFSDVDRDPRERTVSIAWYALVHHCDVQGGDDAAEAEWFPVDSLPKLAFDHDKIFKAAMEALRRDIHFEPLGFELLDGTFTIPDLQRLYEIILGREFDRRNFQRKILASGILEEAPEMEASEMSVPDGAHEINGAHEMEVDEIGAHEMDEAEMPGDCLMEAMQMPRSKRSIGWNPKGPSLSSILMDMPVGAAPMDKSVGAAPMDKPVGAAPKSRRASSEPKSPRGRKGSVWQFNRRKYDEMKEDGGKIEF